MFGRKPKPDNRWYSGDRLQAALSASGRRTGSGPHEARRLRGRWHAACRRPASHLSCYLSTRRARGPGARAGGPAGARRRTRARRGGRGALGRGHLRPRAVMHGDSPSMDGDSPLVSKGSNTGESRRQADPKTPAQRKPHKRKEPAGRAQFRGSGATRPVASQSAPARRAQPPASCRGSQGQGGAKHAAPSARGEGPTTDKAQT